MNKYSPLKDNAIDRRVRKSQTRIQNALFSLMKEMPYQKIRVSQIAKAADISRSTFYLHYETKDALLLGIVDEMIDEYFHAIENVRLGRGESPARLLFLKWQQHIDHLALVVEAGMEYRIYQRLRAYNKLRGDAVESENALLDDTIRTMLDGALFALLLRWTRDHAVVPAKQMAKIFEALNIEALFETLENEMPDFGS